MIKRTLSVLFVFVLTFAIFTGCENDLSKLGNLDEHDVTSRAAAEVKNVKSIFTFYWTFDPTNAGDLAAAAAENPPITPCRCTTQVKDENGNIIPDVHVNTGLLPRYVMEGSGFVMVNGVRKVLNLVDKGSFSRNAHDSRFDSTFVLSAFKWGDAYYDLNENGEDDPGEITALDPFTTCAVTTNIVGGSTVKVYAMNGYSYTDPDDGSSKTHNGNFTARDSSWSFSVVTLPAGYDAWVDLYTGGFDDYKSAETHIWNSWVASEQSTFPANVNDVGVWVKEDVVTPGYTGDQGATWINASFKARTDAPGWTAHGGLYYPGDFVTYSGNTYKCVYTTPAIAGYEPNKPYMWSTWEIQ